MIDLGTIFLFLALLILVGLYVARPLMERRSFSISSEEQTLSALLAERDRLLDAIQELDFDHTLGKIPIDVYSVQRGDLLRRGAEILRKIDDFHEENRLEGSENQLEAAIAARRLEAETTTDSQPIAKPEPLRERVMAGAAIEHDPVEDLIATRRQARAGEAAGFCHQCGQAVQKHDRFCANCGATVGPKDS